MELFVALIIPVQWSTLHDRQQFIFTMQYHTVTLTLPDTTIYFALSLHYYDIMYILGSISLLDAVAYTNAHYGQGTGPILLDDVSCTGTESRLVSCPYDSNTADCSHLEDAGVRCNNTCKQHDSIPTVYHGTIWCVKVPYLDFGIVLL